MTIIRKILVPVDFSEISQRVILFACDLAKKYEAIPTLFFVYRAPSAYFPESYSAFPTEIFDDLYRYYEKTLADAKQEAEKLGYAEPAVKIAEGVPAEEIVREAKEGDFDVIVLGSQGRDGLAKIFLGSVAEKVLRQAHCPVLVVR